MKAIVLRQYGSPDVLELADMPMPETGEGQVLIRVEATSVTTADWRLRASAFPGGLWIVGRLMFGLTRPRHPVPGMEFAGTVAATGPKVRKFRTGDRVFGFAPRGAAAEYLAIDEGGAIAPIPPALDFEGAAALPFGGLSALVFLRDVAKVQPGERVLITGASGGVGVYAVQIAKALGAHVTAIAGPQNQGLLTGIGADVALDYTRDDPARMGTRFDVILDTSRRMSFRQARRALTPEGRYVPLEFGIPDVLRSLVPARLRRQRILIAVNGDSAEDLAVLSGMVEDGRLRPVIDQVYPMERIAAAHAHVEARHRKGSVVVRIAEAAEASRAA